VYEENEEQAKLYAYTFQLFQSHERLLGDLNRNRAFYAALKRHVTPDSSVLDIGSGTGVWAVTAALLGARRVVAIEQDPLLIGLIKTLARENGVPDRVVAIAGDSRAVDLPKEFDIVISETIGNLVFDEQIVPIMIDARSRFLRAGGALIPSSVALVAAGANIGPRQEIPAGIPVSFSRFETLNFNMPLVLDDRSGLRLETSPADLLRVDLSTTDSTPDLAELTARWELSETGKIDSFAVWAEATLTEGVDLTTLRTTSWSPRVYRIAPFTGGGVLEFSLTLTAATNYWTASLSDGASRAVQSYSPAFAAAEVLALARTDMTPFDGFRRAGVIDE
jgi:SAM-dependent methyltransferase